MAVPRLEETNLLSTQLEDGSIERWETTEGFNIRIENAEVRRKREEEEK